MSNYKTSQNRLKQEEIMRSNMAKRERVMNRGAIIFYIIVAAAISKLLPHMSWYIYLIIMIAAVAIIEFSKIGLRRFFISRARAKGKIK